jgi:hypothetical protein
VAEAEAEEAGEAASGRREEAGSLGKRAARLTTIKAPSQKAS